MSYEWRFRPIIIGPALLRCPECGRISEDATYELYRSTNPMPCCGSTGGPREWWPNQATQNFLSVVQHRDTLVDDGDQVRFVFLAVLLEALLEGVLFPLLAIRHGQGRAEEMLSRIQGASRRRGLFDRESDKSLQTVFNEHGYPQFLFWWRRLGELRNKFAHGQRPSVARADHDIAEAIENAVVKAFAAVHNDVIRQCENAQRRLTRSSS